MTSKNPRARHRRFLSAGFFPPELPPCFYSERFGQYRNFLRQAFDKIPKNKNGEPDFQSFRAQRTSFNFPRYRNNDRRHSFINPISYFFLSRVLADKYSDLRKLTKGSKLSLSPSIFDWSGERALKRPIFASRDAYLAQMSARFEFVLHTDIRAFYHSLYTHTIAWAIHTKAFAKKNRSPKHVGNLIDLLCRNAQDGQTVGIPVGPDTSRMIAEIVGAAIDKEIQRKHSPVDDSAMRFVDDFAFGCNAVSEADKIAASVRRSVNEYELDLSGEKTLIQASDASHPGGWKVFIRSIIPTRPYNDVDIEVFLYQIDKLAQTDVDINIEKFAIQNARKVFVECDDWQRVEQYLIATYRKNATIIGNLVEIFILRQLAKSDVSVGAVRELIHFRLPILHEQARNGEVSWLLFLARALKIKIKAEAVEPFFYDNDALAAVQIADLRKQGLTKGTIDRSHWNKSLSEDGLHSDMWLYAYEGTLKNLTGTKKKTHVTNHRYFKHLLAKKIEFYRSPDGIYSMSSTLRRLRKENDSTAKLLTDFKDDLTFDIDELDEAFGNEDADTY
jgi:hypothetical protein